MKPFYLIAVLAVACGSEQSNNPEPIPTPTPMVEQQKVAETKVADKPVENSKPVVVPVVTASPTKEEQAQLDRIACLLGNKSVCPVLPPVTPPVVRTESYNCNKPSTTYDAGHIEVKAQFNLIYKDNVLDEVTHGVGTINSGTINNVPLNSGNGGALSRSQDNPTKTKLDSTFKSYLGLLKTNVNGQPLTGGQKEYIKVINHYVEFDVKTHVLNVHYIVVDATESDAYVNHDIVLNTYNDSVQCVAIP